MYIEKDSVRFFLRLVPSDFFLEGVFFGGIVMEFLELCCVCCGGEGKILKKHGAEEALPGAEEATIMKMSVFHKL